MTTYIYISASLEQSKEARALSGVLFDAGYGMTSGWYAPEKDDPERRSKEAVLSKEDRSMIALANEIAIMNANAFVMILSPRSRGALVEFGIARGRRMPIVVVGDPASITLMLDLPGVWFVSSVSEVVRVLKIALESVCIGG